MTRATTRNFLAASLLYTASMAGADLAKAEPMALAQGETILAQTGGRAYRREERTAPRVIVVPPRRADCHRDVRTHRLGQERVTHRHVGDDCDVRVVNRSSVPRD